MSAQVAIGTGLALNRRARAYSETLFAFSVILTSAALRAVALWPSRDTSGNWYGDQIEYLRVARLPFGAAFLTEHKPWGYPLFLKLLEAGDALDGLVLIQLAISVVAWGALAIVAASLVGSRWLKRAVMIAVVAFSSSWPIAQWDTMPLSESLSLSLFALLLASLIRFVAVPSPSTACASLVLGCYFSVVRDTHAPLTALLFMLVAAVTFRPHRRLALALVATALVVVAATAATAGVRRWEILVADQIGKRAMLDERMGNYFRAAGMPTRPNLSALIFEDTRTFPRPAEHLEHDPRLAFFMPWFMSEGRMTYNHYLLSHPKQAFVAPLRHLPTMIDTTGLTTYHDDDYRPALPRAVSQIVYPSNGTTVALWAIIALLLGHLAALARLLDRTATVPLALLATLVPMEIIVWDGEPSEVPRHGLLVGVSARLALIFLAAIACDNVLRRRNRGEPGASANAASMQRSTHSSSSVGQTVPPPFWVRAIRGTRPSLPNGKPLTQVGEFGARSRATVSLSPVDRIIRHRACSAASLC